MVVTRKPRFHHIAPKLFVGAVLATQAAACGRVDDPAGILAGSRPTAERNRLSTLLLQRSDGGACAAFLVNERTAISAAHCCRYEEGGCTDGRLFAYDESSAGWTREVSVGPALFLDADRDVVALEVVDVPAHVPHVVLARVHGDELVGQPVYLSQNPADGEMEGRVGSVYGFAEQVRYDYRTGVRTKHDQVVYALGDGRVTTLGGEAIFALEGHVLVGIHHTGGVTPELFGLTTADTDGFANLLAGTDGAAIADLLDEHGIEFDELEEE